MYAIFIDLGGLFLYAFLISLAATWAEIPTLRLKAGQNIREDGPQSHLSKAGTPSMGGIAMIFAVAVPVFLNCYCFRTISFKSIAVVCTFIGFAIIGFIDDYLKVVKKRNLGLRAYQKFGLQLILSIAFVVYLMNCYGANTNIYIPIADCYVDFGIFYAPFLVFVMLAMTNSVNLTDGLDGLAAGTTALVAAFFACVWSFCNAFSGADVCAAICGACLGFLIFNKHPAKVFMGDTGSLALGGGLAAAVICMEVELMLPIVGLVYVIEALSVIIQVVYFKLSGGKRVFKMAPIHHHFEKCGHSEVKVVVAFCLFTLLCCGVGLLILWR